MPWPWVPPSDERFAVATLHIERSHALGWTAAQGRVDEWVADAQGRLGLHCERQASADHERVTFSRPGVKGVLYADAGRFELTAQLGFLLSPYADRIQADIERRLDERLGVNGS